MKKIIGVMPLWDDEKNSIWMLPGYLDGIKQAGGIPFIFPFSDDEDELSALMEMCGGILFTGGHDVSPEMYHEIPLLYQDLHLQHPSAVEHHQQAPYDIPSHEVVLIKGTPLQKYLNRDSLVVNSYHHQAVKELAPGLESMAVSPDGLIEALYMPGKRFIWAVQWHPEFSFHNDLNSRRIFSAFIDSI